MNEDEVRSAVVKILIVLLTALATALHIQLGAANIQAMAADLGGLIIVWYGIYDHWNMIKVPEQDVAPSNTVAQGA